MKARHPLPYTFCKEQILLAEAQASGITLMICASTALSAISEVKRTMPITKLERMEQPKLQELISRAYASRGGSAAADIIGAVEDEVDLGRLMQDIPAVEDLLDAADDAPIVRMLNAVFTQAVRESASDIHIEPFESSSVVRFRRDGYLRDIVAPNKALHSALISRIKIMAELDIAEKRLPQDGRISLRLGGRPVDVRVSTLPCAHGERAVLRLLDKSTVKLDLTAIGMPAQTLQRFDHIVRQPHGIVLVTGPTGSGKTTTLYSAISRLDANTTNILTVEDPIEYDLQGVGQTQVNPRIDLSFARALRAILRQDPDVIMIGEIRDFETAQIAIQASLTGHLVLATVHTNNAPATITRLIDMGVEPFLLSSSLLAVLAQRLVRLLCKQCRRQDADGMWHPVGCEVCARSGYLGRTGIFELMEVSDSLRTVIHARKSEAELRQVAMTEGLQGLREDGRRLVESGETSLEELLRVTRD